MTSPRLKPGRVANLADIYTITTVTAARRPLFQHADVARTVIEGMQLCETEQRLGILAYVVMPDHLHWLFELKATSLCSCMRVFKSRSAIAINVTLGSKGTVWQPGYYDRRLRGDEDLRVQARYLIDNPVRRGLVESIDQYPHWASKWVTRNQDLV